MSQRLMTLNAWVFFLAVGGIGWCVYRAMGITWLLFFVCVLTIIITAIVQTENKGKP